MAPFLRSAVQGEILALLLLRPETSLSIADIVRETGGTPTVVHTEVSRLVESGVLTDTRVGRARLVRANPDYPLLRPLTEIVAATFGPVPVLGAALTGVAGIREAYVYGSWAARAAGEPGPLPRDVDVLVVGDADRAALNEAAAAAEETLRVPVSITKVAASSWAEATEPFLRTVRSRPMVRLDVATVDA